ncbi:MAG: DUF3570 domain-containing protein [Deltaproteobacteria bacterium]|nr:DUF3570 domain-containing protein [Deltaproteobacteria bacterium]
MLLRRAGLRLLLLTYILLASTSLLAQSAPPVAPADPEDGQGIDVDFLFNYYDQDGNRSPVTGGIGSEDLQVITPVIVLKWQKSDRWSFSSNLGVDNITSASTDNIDDDVSSASRLDNRAHVTFAANRTAESQRVGFNLGFSKEYDYSSFSGGLSWSRDFNQKNTTLSASLQHYSDTVELYDIDGVLRGEDDRTTTDFSLSVTQVLGKRTVGTLELYSSQQDGFLSTPFHEVILADGVGGLSGERVAERLPDTRSRMAVGLHLNHAFSKKVVQRGSLRFYDDDWGVTSMTLSLETHFRLPTRLEMWAFPILRYYDQDESDYYGAPRVFTLADPFFTADRDLGEFSGEKFGVGWKVNLGRRKGGVLRSLRSFETRITSYSQDDGFDALSVSWGVGWSF